MSLRSFLWVLLQILVSTNVKFYLIFWQCLNSCVWRRVVWPFVRSQSWANERSILWDQLVFVQKQQFHWGRYQRSLFSARLQTEHQHAVLWRSAEFSRLELKWMSFPNNLNYGIKIYLFFSDMMWELVWKKTSDVVPWKCFGFQIKTWIMLLNHWWFYCFLKTLQKILI